MPHKNVEIKARCDDLDAIRRILIARDARSIGTDRQVDTYFNVPAGRLKLRHGDIERSLIFYRRDDQPGPKRADVNLLQLGPQQCEPLAELLTASLTVKLRVVKRRDIYFLDNVKVHLDTVDDLGTFVEIEAIDEDGSRSVESLEAQCRRLMAAFGIDRGQLVPHSYSDLLSSR